MILEFDNGNDFLKYYISKLLIEKTIKSKNKKNVNTYKKEITELHPIFFKLKNPKKIIFNNKTYNCIPYWVISEICTEMLGLNPSIMNDYRKDIMEWSYDLLESGRSCYQYGVRWLNHNSLEKTYQRLLKNPTSKRCYVPIFDQNDVGDSKDAPCNLGFLFLIRNKKLDMTLFTRSIDITKGFRYDFSLFSFIQQCLASWLKVDIGDFYYYCNSLHYYGNNLDELLKIKKDLDSNESEINELDIDKNMDIGKTYKDLLKIRELEVLIRNKVKINLNIELKKLNYKFAKDFVRIYWLKNNGKNNKILNSMETKCKQWCLE